MAGADDEVARQPRGAGFRDGHGAVVRALEAAEKSAEPVRRAAGDDSHFEPFRPSGAASDKDFAAAPEVLRGAAKPAKLPRRRCRTGMNSSREPGPPARPGPPAAERWSAPSCS